MAGRIDEAGGEITFAYADSYRDRDDAIALYLPELPLGPGRIRPLPDLDTPGCILDAGPDSWGQRVIMNRLLGAAAADADPAALGTMTFLLESASDKTGALDFHSSPSDYVARGDAPATLEQLVEGSEAVEEGVPLPPDLDEALRRGTSIGGARPKAQIEHEGKQLIAKFPSTTDPFAVVQGEFVAMELARRAGLDVAPVRLVKALGRPVLLVERFDRAPGTRHRRAVVSALTMLELNELAARWASYFELAQIVRERFTSAAETLRELFSRIVFNILVGNTDDHARNHAAFWDGEMLTLTPAYDICPQVRNTGEATQGMIIGDDSDSYRLSNVAGCVRRAHLYQLREQEAREIAERQIAVIHESWTEVCDLAELTEIERRYFWSRQFLNPFALQEG